MPLSTKGKKILNEFRKEYGSKKGEMIFYAWENKNKEVRKYDKKRTKGII